MGGGGEQGRWGGGGEGYSHESGSLCMRIASLCYSTVDGGARGGPRGETEPSGGLGRRNGLMGIFPSGFTAVTHHLHISYRRSVTDQLQIRYICVFTRCPAAM